MEQEHKALRVGAVAILCAILCRLIGSGFFQPVVDLLQQPKAVAFLMYLETGRTVRFRDDADALVDWAAESPAPELTESPTVPQAVFSAQDLDLVELRYSGSYDPDLEALLTSALDLDLTGEDPTVLIFHTHTTESYTRVDGQDYEESSSYRTLNENYNLLRVGDALQAELEKAGISVLHDRTLHDYPSYNDSYSHSRSAVKEYLEQYPSIQLVLDIHRDASESNGMQMATSVTLDGTSTARLMMVMGTGENSGSHPNWQQNLSLALKLQVQLEKLCPGITRPLTLRGTRYNQDLSPNMLLIEVGAAGDTLQDALNAMPTLAKAIASLG